jgi:hypothetical protein
MDLTKSVHENPLVESLKRLNDQLITRVKKFDEEKVELLRKSYQERLDEREIQNEKHLGHIKELNERHMKFVLMFKKMKDASQERLKAVEAESADIRKRLEGKDKETSDLITTLRSEKDALDNSKMALQAENERLQTQLTKVTSDFKALENDYAYAEEAFEEERKRVEEETEKREKSKHELESAKKDIDLKERHISYLEKKLKTATKDIDDQNAQIQGFQGRLDLARSQTKAAQDQIEGMKVTEDGSRQDVQSLRDRVDFKQAQVEDLKRALIVAETKLTEFPDTKKELQKSKAVNRGLQTAISKLTADIERSGFDPNPGAYLAKPSSKDAKSKRSLKTEIDFSLDEGDQPTESGTEESDSSISEISSILTSDGESDHSEDQTLVPRPAHEGLNRPLSPIRRARKTRILEPTSPTTPGPEPLVVQTPLAPGPKVTEPTKLKTLDTPAPQPASPTTPGPGPPVVQTPLAPGLKALKPIEPDVPVIPAPKPPVQSSVQDIIGTTPAPPQYPTPPTEPVGSPEPTSIIYNKGPVIYISQPWRWHYFWLHFLILFVFWFSKPYGIFKNLLRKAFRLPSQSSPVTTPDTPPRTSPRARPVFDLGGPSAFVQPEFAIRDPIMFTNTASGSGLPFPKDPSPPPTGSSPPIRPPSPAGSPAPTPRPSDMRHFESGDSPPVKKPFKPRISGYLNPAPWLDPTMRPAHTWSWRTILHPDPKRLPDFRPTFLGILVHLLVLAALLMGLDAYNERSLWLAANDHTRSFLLDVLNNPSHYYHGLSHVFFITLPEDWRRAIDLLMFKYVVQFLDLDIHHQLPG